MIRTPKQFNLIDAISNYKNLFSKILGRLFAKNTFNKKQILNILRKIKIKKVTKKKISNLCNLDVEFSTMHTLTFNTSSRHLII